MKRLSLLLVALVAAFALHAQEVNDSINNNASNGRVMYFTGEVDYDYDNLENWRVGSPDGAPADSLPVEPNPDMGWTGDDVILLSNCEMTWDSQFRNITIEDGVQLHFPPADGITFIAYATIKKHIEPYELHVNDFGWNPNGWNLISIPVDVPRVSTQRVPDTEPFFDYASAGFFNGGVKMLMLKFAKLAILK